MSESPSKPPTKLSAEADAPPEKVSVNALHAPIMREQREPRDGYEPVPLWLVAVFGAIIFWAGWYLATYNGGFRHDILDEDPAVRFAGTGANPAPMQLDPMVLGKRIFTGKGTCISCHQATGQGVPGQYPPLAGSEWVQGSPARLKRILLHGLEGPIHVKGAVFNSQMPLFAQKLNDEEIAAVLTYVRGNTAWGNNAAPVTPAEVAATRAATRDRVLVWSEAELLAVTQDEVPALPSTAPAPQPVSTGARQP